MPKQWCKISFTRDAPSGWSRVIPSIFRRPIGSDEYDQQWGRKTVNHSTNFMVWGMFEGATGRRGLEFLKSGTTMNISPYIKTM